MSDRIFGHIPGYPEGSWFSSRAELSQAGVHRPTQAGIAGSQKEGADSIVLSGGYEDDEDHGDWIIYTGQGGRDVGTGIQIENQLLNRGNLALAKSCLYGLPVRVIRRLSDKTFHDKETGYRYDGLYRVEEYWKERGVSGFYVWRFRLQKISDEPADRVAEEESEYRLPDRIQVSTVRIIRDTEQTRRLKEMYDYRCQVCGIRLEGSAGPYAEAAHIKPLGRPHNGPDSLDNLICLCPNHHVLFDYGGFSIADDLSLVGLEGTLLVCSSHQICLEYIQYHREHYIKFEGCS